MVIDDKQVDTIAARKRLIGEFLFLFHFIQIFIFFVFLSLSIVRLYRVLLISCYNGFFRNLIFTNLKLFFYPTKLS